MEGNVHSQEVFVCLFTGESPIAVVREHLRKSKNRHRGELIWLPYVRPTISRIYPTKRTEEIVLYKTFSLCSVCLTIKILAEQHVIRSKELKNE